MRPKLLKKMLKGGRLTLGVSVGVIASRFAVDYLTKKMEREAHGQQKVNGSVSPDTEKQLKVYRFVRGILHML